MSFPTPSPSSTGAPEAQAHRNLHLNIVLIPATLAAGALAWFGGILIYDALVDTIPRPLLIGLIFGLLCLLVGLVVYLVSMLTRQFAQNLITQDAGGVQVLLLVLALSLAMVLAGALLQWIYGLNFNVAPTDPTSYIFVIDDSGSMANNDQEQDRYKAISVVLEGKPDDFPYMIYSFSNDTTLVREMGPVSDGVPEIPSESYGGTSIKGALIQVMDDYEAGVWEGGDAPRVILLTDGYATDMGIFFNTAANELRRYVAKHISISTVGLGQVDESLMNKIAKMTGGVFINVADASQLSSAMNSAAAETADRDLLSVRYVPKWDTLYAIMRVLFLALLGTGLGFVASLAYGNPDSVSMLAISTVVKAVLGALVMEIGVNMLGLPDKIIWLVLWLLLALTLTLKVSHAVSGYGTTRIYHNIRSPQETDS